MSYPSLCYRSLIKVHKYFLADKIFLIVHDLEKRKLYLCEFSLAEFRAMKDNVVGFKRKCTWEKNVLDFLPIDKETFVIIHGQENEEINIELYRIKDFMNPLITRNYKRPEAAGPLLFFCEKDFLNFEKSFEGADFLTFDISDIGQLFVEIYKKNLSFLVHKHEELGIEGKITALYKCADKNIRILVQSDGAATVYIFNSTIQDATKMFSIEFVESTVYRTGEKDFAFNPYNCILKEKSGSLVIHDFGSKTYFVLPNSHVPYTYTPAQILFLAKYYFYIPKKMCMSYSSGPKKAVVASAQPASFSDQMLPECKKILEKEHQLKDLTYLNSSYQYSYFLDARHFLEIIFHGNEKTPVTQEKFPLPLVGTFSNINPKQLALFPFQNHKEENIYFFSIAPSENSSTEFQYQGKINFTQKQRTTSLSLTSSASIKPTPEQFSTLHTGPQHRPIILPLGGKVESRPSSPTDSLLEVDDRMFEPRSRASSYHVPEEKFGFPDDEFGFDEEDL
jgi:hypothetical protein